MELDEYLKALTECPDEFVLLNGQNRPIQRLTADFGVYDNFPILLSADYDEVIKDLINSTSSTSLFSGQYGFDHDSKMVKASEINKIFLYVPGSVKFQVYNWAAQDISCISLRDVYSRFNMTLKLHTYSKKQVEGLNWERVFANVITDIGRYAQKKEISLCFPSSRGWSAEEDLSRIVFYKPKE